MSTARSFHGGRCCTTVERLAAAIGAGEPLMLWFEADLFDLLLILQIVDRLPEHIPARLVLVGQDEWRSVTDVEPEKLRTLGREAPELSPEQRQLARRAWAAFTSDTPYPLERLAGNGTPALPAVGDAARRLLQELPWIDTGLSRTERQLLEAIVDGARTREEAFHAAIAAEERPFLGDGSAFAVLDRLAPLLDGMRLNDRGAAILVGGHTWEAPEERWIGGNRIPPGRPPWHWVPPNGRIWEG